MAEDWTELRRLGIAAQADGAWYNAPFLVAFIDGDDEQVIPAADAAYIASASPDRILRLLNRLDELEAKCK